VNLADYPGGAELAPALESLARRTGVALDRVHVWLTRERKIANAAVSGLFRRQRAVFLTDYLLKRLSRDEIVAVVAHELGHAKFHHLVFNFLLAIMSGVFVIWGIVGMSSWLETQQDVGFAIVALEAFYILGVFGLFARRFERQADLYAAYVTRSPRTVANALLQLARANNVSVRRGSITHPSIHSRIKRLTKLARDFGDDLSRPVRGAVLGNVVIALTLIVLFIYTVAHLEDLPL
jgi:Zn-dependent protease with chaperone function